MESKPLLRVSVQALIEYVFKTGDLAFGFSGSSRAVKGIRGHQEVQKSASPGYISEVPVSLLVDRQKLQLEINGRIDGILETANETIIEEIKTTTDHLDAIHQDYNPLHWAQAKCYAYIYGTQNNIDPTSIRLTYYHIESGETKSFNQTFPLAELDRFFNNIVDQYAAWVEAQLQWTDIRNASIRKLKFPYPDYRLGQREMAVSVYRAIKDARMLFVQAPTGIGKTAAALFPAIKAMEKNFISKIFYLTAKTITRTVAEAALENMLCLGLRLKVVSLTAKEKICPHSDIPCDPLMCEYAHGYFDRLNDALRDALQHDFLTRQVIEKYAQKHRVCPFEFSLDLAQWGDCVICDYNYVFDPRVYLKRFFMTKGDWTFLVDEAHNLADRAREMFSAELYKKPFLNMKKATKNHLPALSKTLHRINAFMVGCRKICEEEERTFHVQTEVPTDLPLLLESFLQQSEEWLAGNDPAPFRDDLQALYFDVHAFLKTIETYDHRYVTYYEKYGNDIKIKLFCLDPSYLLQEGMKKGKSAVFFSATLTPIDYFIRILGGDSTSLHMVLPSPFPRENLCLMVDDRISTRYRDRPSTYDKITHSISTVVSARPGNYLIYFPSYQYMNEIHNRFCLMHPEIRVIMQTDNMSETQRETFLDQFTAHENETLVGFAVMGGIFGEGIDLPGDRLSGAVIVGVGLPQMCLERELIRQYFQEIRGSGFEYAYTYPGMNKVLQALGRVIRTETDRGVVLLVDDRFSNYIYRQLYPYEWHPVPRIGKPHSLTHILESFWSQKK